MIVRKIDAYLELPAVCERQQLANNINEQLDIWRRPLDVLATLAIWSAFTVGGAVAIAAAIVLSIAALLAGGTVECE